MVRGRKREKGRGGWEGEMEVASQPVDLDSEEPFATTAVGKLTEQTFSRAEPD